MQPTNQLFPTPQQLSTHEIVQDLRGPLTSLLAASGVLVTASRPDEVANQVESVRQFAQRLGTALNDLEDLESLRRGVGEHVEDAFDLLQLLQNCVRDVEPSFAERALELRVDIDPGVPHWSQGDPARLRLLITRCLEVVTQACSISPIDFSVSAHSTSILLSIVHGDPSAHVDGGISVALCQELASFLRGSLTIDERSGGGISLLLTLPRQAAPGWEINLLEQDALRSTPSIDVGPARLHGSVLLIENTPDHMFLIAKMVSNLGAKVTAAGNGQIALHLLDNVSFDLVLLDMEMPEMDSFATVQELRRRNLTTPVLALTNTITTNDLERCLAAGCNGCVTKPIDVSLLRRSLAMHLSTTR